MSTSERALGRRRAPTRAILPGRADVAAIDDLRRARRGLRSSARAPRTISLGIACARAAPRAASLPDRAVGLQSTAPAVAKVGTGSGACPTQARRDRSTTGDGRRRARDGFGDQGEASPPSDRPPDPPTAALERYRPAEKSDGEPRERYVVGPAWARAVWVRGTEVEVGVVAPPDGPARTARTRGAGGSAATRCRRLTDGGRNSCAGAAIPSKTITDATCRRG